MVRDIRYSLLEQTITTSRLGAAGLSFVPLSGGYVRDGETLKRGPTGLAVNHSRADIIRAVMEGISFELDLLLSDVVQKLPVKRLWMIGGAARNPYWPQILADITGLPVAVPNAKGAASLGAAILAGRSLGWYSDKQGGQTKPGKEFLPDQPNHEGYTRVKNTYRQVRLVPPNPAE